jgi:hypothetical protein
MLLSKGSTQKAALRFQNPVRPEHVEGLSTNGLGSKIGLKMSVQYLLRGY